MKIFCRKYTAILTIVATLSLIQCREVPKTDASRDDSENKAAATIEKSAYGKTPQGEYVDLYKLKNQAGMEVDIITYGGRITLISVPDRNGHFDNVVLGFDNLEDYLKDNPFFGALVGRYGNRIAGARFTLDGKEYALAANDGVNSLHGGLKGFDKVLWQATDTIIRNNAILNLRYVSKDMEEGFPGNLTVEVTYTLTGDNTVEVAYEAATDKKTVVNLTQHSYFNLSGDFSKPILDHELRLDADAYLPVNETLIPTGEPEGVKGTPFDFTTPKKIGKDIGLDDDQLKKGGGYDHCWILNENGKGLHPAAVVYDETTGRQMEVRTTEPAIQFYTGNFLDGTLHRPDGGTYGHRSGLCLETQHYPNSPNEERFPSVQLAPGENYTTTTTFSFSTK